MKKLSSLKIIQLSVLTMLTLAAIFLFLQDAVKQFIFASPPATILFILFWILMILSFLFLLLDFDFIRSTRLNYQELYEAAYADSVSGLPNRFSCDILIEKYTDTSLPEDIGCVMLDLINLPEVNSANGHTAGNELLRQFSAILSSSSLSLGFVGRNGGNKFLALFEECGSEKLDNFLRNVSEKVRQHNETSETSPIQFRSGCALNSQEHLDWITDLIALANQRIYQSSDCK